jgi:hypothetical protein
MNAIHISIKTPELCEAVMVANKLLCNETLIRLGLSDLMRGKFEKLQIDFLFTKEFEYYAWTTRVGKRPKNVRKLHVNQYFQERLGRIISRDIEFKTICVFIGIYIVHEVAHLVISWQGLNKTPLEFEQEAGNFLESCMFRGGLARVIYSTAVSETWSSDTPMAGTAITLST